MSVNQLDIPLLQAALQGELPGPAAQAKMGLGHARRSRPQVNTPLRIGAVLILLYPQHGKMWFPLELRTEKVAEFKGQVSLPGGQREVADATLWDTALRETYEEVGVEPGQVGYVGMLSSYYIAVSHFEIHPFVGWMATEPVFATSSEVAAIINLPVSALLDPAVKSTAVRILDGHPAQVPCYRYQDYEIWGATAMILSEFEAVLANI